MKLEYILLLLLIIPFSTASNQYGNIISGGNLIVTDVDVTVDGKVSRNLDYGEEVRREARPNSKIEFSIELMNNHSALTMTDVEIVIEIDELDLEEASDEVDIENIDDKVFKLSMILPSDVEERDYEVSIRAEGKQNSTIHEVRYELDLVVEFEEEEVITSNPTSLSELIRTLNDTLTEVSKERKSYFEPYTTCTDDLSTKKGELKTKQEEVETLKKFESMYNDCQLRKEAKQVEVDDLKQNKEGLLINMTRIQSEAKGSSDKIIYIVIAIVAGGLFLFSKYKDKIFPKEKSPEKE